MSAPKKHNVRNIVIFVASIVLLLVLVFFGSQNFKQKAVKSKHTEPLNMAIVNEDDDALTDQQADKIFQDYINDGKKRDEISYEVYEATPDKVTIEVNAKTVNIADIDYEQLSSSFEDEFMNKHKDDEEIDEEEVIKEATQYIIDKLPELISKEDVSSDETDYKLEMTKKDGKWEVETTGSDSYDYEMLKDQFLGGLSTY